MQNGSREAAPTCPNKVLKSSKETEGISELIQKSNDHVLKRAQKPPEVQAPRNYRRIRLCKIAGNSLALRCGAVARHATIKLSTQAGKKERRTKTIKKTLDPKWNETFEWIGQRSALCDGGNASLDLRVFDKDLLSRDDEIGSSKVLTTPTCTLWRRQQAPLASRCWCSCRLGHRATRRRSAHEYC